MLSLNPLLIDPAVRAALEEDLGRAGDITTQATIPAGTRASAVMAARKAGTIAGLPLAAAAFRLLDPSLRFDCSSPTGRRSRPGRRSPASPAMRAPFSRPKGWP